MIVAPIHTTTRAMHIFVHAVEQNSFVQAARSLLMDPSAVSRTISALEKDLGVLLFARSTRKLKLTAEGARFHRDCIQILERFNRATQMFHADKSSPQGLLKIGVTPGLRRRLLLRIIPHFQRQFPRIEIVIVSVNDPTDISDKGVDVLVRVRSMRRHGGTRSDPQGLVVRRLFRSPYVICASQEYLDRAGTLRVPADLLHHACIPHVSLERDFVDEWHFGKSDERQRVKFTPSLRIQGADAICEAAVAGCGIIRTLVANIEDELHSRRLVPVLRDWECTSAPPALAIYRKTRPIVPQIAAFIHYLSEAFRQYDVHPSSPRRSL